MSDPLTAEFPHVGVGWAFPVRWEAGAAMRSADEERVRSAMILILRTRLGERVMRPDFGADADRFVFAPNTDQVRFQLAYLVEQALLRWEPRVIVDAVDAVEADEGARIDVTITYRIDTHRRPSSIVLPFAIEERP